MWAKLTSIILLLGLGLGVGWYSLWLNDFAVTPDVAGLACAADYLAEHGTTRPYELQATTYEMCWRPTTYPALQYIHAGLLTVLPVSAITLVEITTVAGFIACVLLVWLLVYIVSKSHLAAVLGGVLAISTPALVRSLVLTPQNLFGYALVLVILICLFLSMGPRLRWYWLIPVLPLLGATNYMHVLSFSVGFFIVAVWVALVLLPTWWLKLLAVISGISLIMTQYILHWLPPVLGDKFDYFLSSTLAGIDHPWWDHPAIWGYLVTALAAIGLAVWPLTNKQRATFAIMIGIPFLFGHLSAFGVGLLPNRFIPFAWLALTPLAALGLYSLIKTKQLPGWLRGSLVAAIIVTQATHAFVFMSDDVTGLSYRYRPHAGYAEALEWLSEYDPDAELLGVQSAENQEILLAPLWYTGHTSYYPWYALNHRDLKKFNVANPSSPYAGIVDNPADPNYTWLHDLFMIISTPNTTAATQAINRQQLDYLIIPKESKVYRQVWVDVKPELRPIVYSSDTYVIYGLTH